MANKKAKVAVIILNWNRKDDTVACVKSLDRMANGSYDLSIIVVDNGSTDGSVEEFNKIGNIPFKTIPLKENIGFAAGNNVGIKNALEGGADYLMILNDDTLVEKNLVKALLKAAKEHKNSGIFVPKIYFAPGFEFHKDRYPKNLLGKVIWSAGGNIDWNNVYGTNNGVDDVDRGQYDEEKETDFATGACMFVRRKVLEALGGFDERYYAYLEDLELCQRAKAAGWKIYYIPDGVVWHKVSQSSGIGSNLNDYFITRNRLLFGLKYANFRTKLALIRESLKFIITGRKWQRIGLIDYYLHRFGKGSWK